LIRYSHVTVSDAEIAANNKRKLHAALAKLDPRERVMVEERHLRDEEPATFATLGETFAITRERARQIEARALLKLKDALRKAA
jgi:RNA polymerase sigma-32 factor